MQGRRARTWIGIGLVLLGIVMLNQQFSAAGPDLRGWPAHPAAPEAPAPPELEAFELEMQEIEREIEREIRHEFEWQGHNAGAELGEQLDQSIGAQIEREIEQSIAREQALYFERDGVFDGESALPGSASAVVVGLALFLIGLGLTRRSQRLALR